MKRVTEVTDVTFRRDVLQAGMPVLVDFWSPWSQERDLVERKLEGVAQRFDGQLRVVMVNVEESPDVTRALRIAEYPTVVVFCGEQVMEIRSGALPEPQYEALVEQVLVHAA
jgi:thioredoxin 1